MKAKHLSLPLAMTLALGACNDMLTEEPESFITTDTYYKTPADIESAAVAMYSLFLDWNFFKVQQHWTFELAADQGRFHPDEPNVETQAPQYLNWTTTSRDAIQPWRLHYANILRANIVLDKAPAVIFPSADKQNELIGEAKFIRAFDYFWLLRAYGGVPLLTSVEEQRLANEPRATEAEVLDQVIQDATEAAQALPLRRTGSELGRATRGAALTLLADAYRWKANVVSKSADDWRKSAEAAKQVMDSGVYSLLPNYIENFTARSEQRPEEIFAIVSTGTGWNQAGLWGGVYWPRNLNAGGGWAVVVPTPGFYHSFPEGDYRKESMFWTRGCEANEPVDCASPKDFTPHNYPGFSTVGHPHVNKYRVSDRGINFWSGNDVNIPMYRYADVLLIYAEAQEALGNTGEALRAINEVRARARKGTGGESRAEPADLTSITKDAIYQERSWELAYELKRWFDLVQRGEQYFVSQLSDNDPLSTQMGNVKPTHMRLPIPGEEIKKNPQITQNPGY